MATRWLARRGVHYRFTPDDDGYRAVMVDGGSGAPGSSADDTAKVGGPGRAVVWTAAITALGTKGLPLEEISASISKGAHPVKVAVGGR